MTPYGIMYLSMKWFPENMQFQALVQVVTSTVYVNIDWANGFLPVWHQAIIWTNAEFMSINFSENINWNTIIFFQDNAFENIICKMLVIFFRSHCVKIWWTPADEGWALYDKLYGKLTFCGLNRMAWVRFRKDLL